TARPRGRAVGPSPWLRLVADEDRDLAVAPELRIAEAAGLDPAGGDARVDQRLAHVAHALVVGAVDPEAAGRIEPRVLRDLARLHAVGSLDTVAVLVERVVAVHAPAAVAGQWSLRARGPDRALRSRGAAASRRTAHSGEVVVALRTGVSLRALCACRARGAGGAGRTHRRHA